MNDEILRWTYYLQQVIRQLSPGAPTPISRLIAMMYGATYDAVNSITPTATPYLGKVTVLPTCSVDRNQCLAAAVNTAAATTLATALAQPSIIAYVNAAQAAEAQRIGQGVGAASGTLTGNLAATQMTLNRLNDGSSNKAPYTPGTEPGAGARLATAAPPPSRRTGGWSGRSR